MHKEKNLQVQWMQLAPNLYTCEITDNGIWRVQALQYHHDGLKSGNHHSRGLEICMERATLYRNMYHKQFNIEISGRYSAENTVEGSRVRITFESAQATGH